MSEQKGPYRSSRSNYLLLSIIHFFLMPSGIYTTVPSLLIMSLTLWKTKLMSYMSSKQCGVTLAIPVEHLLCVRVISL